MATRPAPKFAPKPAPKPVTPPAPRPQVTQARAQVQQARAPQPQPKPQPQPVRQPVAAAQRSVQGARFDARPQPGQVTPGIVPQPQVTQPGGILPQGPEMQHHPGGILPSLHQIKQPGGILPQPQPAPAMPEHPGFRSPGDMITPMPMPGTIPGFANPGSGGKMGGLPPPPISGISGGPATKLPDQAFNPDETLNTEYLKSLFPANFGPGGPGQTSQPIDPALQAQLAAGAGTAGWMGPAYNTGMSPSAGLNPQFNTNSGQPTGMLPGNAPNFGQQQQSTQQANPGMSGKMGGTRP